MLSWYKTPKLKHIIPYNLNKQKLGKHPIPNAGSPTALGAMSKSLQIYSRVCQMQGLTALFPWHRTGGRKEPSHPWLQAGRAPRISPKPWQSTDTEWRSCSSRNGFFPGHFAGCWSQAMEGGAQEVRPCSCKSCQVLTMVFKAYFLDFPPMGPNPKDGNVSSLGNPETKCFPNK